MPYALRISTHHLTLLLLLVSISLIACSPTAQPTPTPEPRLELSISGATSVSSVLGALESQFEADVKSRDLNVLSGTTTAAGVQGMLEGILTAAALLRPLNEEEIAQQVQYAPLGQTAVAFIVHPLLDIEALSSDEVLGIYRGKITNWAEVGGPDQEIVVFGRGETESHTVLLRSVIFGDALFPETVTIAPSHGALLTAVETTPNSIGYTVWAAALASETQAKSVLLDDISVSSAEYPVLAQMGIGYMEAQQSTVQPLLDWLKTERGQAALSTFGVILPTASPQ